MRYTINVGLHTNTGGNISADTVTRVLRALGIKVVTTDVFDSDSEPTAVLAVENSDTILEFSRRIHVASLALDQDCIATYSELHQGRLIGPKAAAWGEFNPDYFITTEGERLGVAA